MAGFTPIEKLRPPAVVELPVSAFQEKWHGRPAAPVTVGLCHVASGTDEIARGEAAKRALEMHKEPGEMQDLAYADALMRYIVARSTCRPDDVSQPFWQFPETTVQEALTSEGVRLIWDRYERMLVETSPLDPPATDEEIGDLVELLVSGALTDLVGPLAKRARKLLRFVLTDLQRL